MDILFDVIMDTQKKCATFAETIHHRFCIKDTNVKNYTHKLSEAVTLQLANLTYSQ
jgi:hypothetical protein